MCGNTSWDQIILFSILSFSEDATDRGNWRVLKSYAERDCKRSSTQIITYGRGSPNFLDSQQTGASVIFLQHPQANRYRPTFVSYIVKSKQLNKYLCPNNVEAV